MSNILKLSNDISLGKNILIRSASSVGGYVRTQRGGPTLFTIEAELPLLQTADHLVVQEELQSIDEGIQFLTAAIPPKAFLTPWRGSITQSLTDEAIMSQSLTDRNLIIDTANTSGSRVTFINTVPSGALNVNANGETVDEWINDDPENNTAANFVIDGIENRTGSQVFAGDFIQFSNSTKVFQIKQDAISNETGVLTVILNQSVIIDLAADTGWVTGDYVRFKLQLTSQPVVNAIPQSENSNLYQYNTFEFREVL